MNIFYRMLLNNKNAIKFLKHDTVKSRLRQTLALWLNDAFIFRSQSDHISKTIWVLGNITKDMIEEENGRELLTHLFNRRYQMVCVSQILPTYGLLQK